MDGMTYEIFVRRAYKCDRYGRKAADADIYRGLDYEWATLKQKPNDPKTLKSYQKRFDKVKEYTIDTLNQGLKRLRKEKGSQQAIDDLTNCLTSATAAQNKDDISKAIQEGLDLFVKHNIGWD